MSPWEEEPEAVAKPPPEAKPMQKWEPTKAGRCRSNRQNPC